MFSGTVNAVLIERADSLAFQRNLCQCHQSEHGNVSIHSGLTKGAIVGPDDVGGIARVWIHVLV